MISVCICTYNRVNLLPSIFRNIEEVLPPKEPAEFLFIDNNSSDNTREIICRFINAYPNFNFRYILEEENQGVSYSRNRGVKEARGQIITFLDDDTLMDKNWLRAIEACFEETDCAVMGGKILPLFETELPTWLKKRDLYKRFHGIVISHDLGEEGKYYNVEDPMPFGSNMAIKKESFAKYGNFRTDLGRTKTLTSHEDIEFAFRLLKGGERIFYNPEAIIYHRIFQDRLRVSYFIRWMFYTGTSTAKMEELPGAFSILTIPSYNLKSFVSVMARFWVYLLLKLDLKNCFNEVMELISYLGYFWGKFRRALRNEE